MKTYTYGKLTKAAKEHAREVWRDQIIHDGGNQFDDDVEIEDAKAIGKLLGLDIENVYWSGFSSQGDGACFEGSWHAHNINIPELVEEWPTETKLHEMAYWLWAVKRQFPNASFTVKHSGHYYHKRCTEFTVSIANDEGDEYDTPESEQVNDGLMEMARDFMDWIYKRLEAAYEYEMSDENIADILTGNEYEFTHSGDRIN